jgi:hypothetical protein
MINHISKLSIMLIFSNFFYKYNENTSRRNRNEDNNEILMTTAQNFLYITQFLYHYNYNFYNVGYEFRIVFEL